jgi:hypothetical protein
LFPLQPIKGNLPRLQGALGELRSFADELSAGQRRSYMRSSLFDGIQEALMQFKRHFHSVKQDVPSSSSNFPSQVEIVILSSCDIPTLQKSILRIIEQLELENLKKIQIVCVNDPDKVIQQTEDELDQLDITDGDSPNELCLSLFDVASCSNDVTSLQSLLKSWMFDCSTDSEHVQITLPSHGHPLILKCDLQERMIQPSLLSSFTKNLSLHTGGDVPSSSSISGRSNSTYSASVPIYKLKAIGTLSSDGVCDSVVYGMPYIISSTLCWKLDWEDLETNQLKFQALCYHLKEKSQMLLLSCDGLSSGSSSNQVLSYYVLMSSASSYSTLLLKAITCNELVLPVEALERDEQVIPQSEYIETIGESLSMLNHQNIYDPLTSCSQLYRVMSSTNRPRGRECNQSGRGRGRGNTKRKATGPLPQVVHVGMNSSARRDRASINKRQCVAMSDEDTN